MKIPRQRLRKDEIAAGTRFACFDDPANENLDLRSMSPGNRFVVAPYIPYI